MTQKHEPGITLAVDTSGRAGSVAVGVGKDLWASRPFSGALRHNAELFPTIQDLLREFNENPARIAYIGITSGPGSFTGIRIAVTLAKMIAMANNAAIVTTRSSDALIRNLQNEGGYEYAATIIDAKRGMFFTAVFQNIEGKWVKIVDDRLIQPQEFVELAEGYSGKICLLGEGLEYYSDRFAGEKIEIAPKDLWSVRADNVYRIAQDLIEASDFVEPEKLKPFYLRRADAVKKSRAK
ncbi:universal bacterial protein YeaZ [Anaerohalosphaera lusitana]|uniref:Universal bacterial protein YeaZ n=1 Tax=Anaerohalosphaera lusitana TaxID=1936003 RepID=A0A1U9NR34_9BACT|nr:tRNA (adenosine(37)-N6)-threonylcarbamoyltransferase complex dimerization subunit type 1 TsaB [Anaerohalosphaera lusitana]AQT70247.1 universal bacterial protein YeaZ [Anaerohalosphaera lusitana]